MKMTKGKMLNHIIEKLEDGKYVVREEGNNTWRVDGDYLTVLCGMLDYSKDYEINVEIGKEPHGFPNDSEIMLTQRVIEMHNKLAVVKDALYHSQLRLRVKD